MDNIGNNQYDAILKTENLSNKRPSIELNDEYKDNLIERLHQLLKNEQEENEKLRKENKQLKAKILLLEQKNNERITIINSDANSPIKPNEDYVDQLIEENKKRARNTNFSVWNQRPLRISESNLEDNDEQDKATIVSTRTSLDFKVDKDFVIMKKDLWKKFKIIKIDPPLGQKKKQTINESRENRLRTQESFEKMSKSKASKQVKGIEKRVSVTFYESADRVKTLADNIVTLGIKPVVIDEIEEVDSARDPDETVGQNETKEHEFKGRKSGRKKTRLVFPQNKAIIKSVIDNKNIVTYPPKKLFEDFFVIGVSKDDVKEFEIATGSRKGKLDARILYNYPSNDKKLQESPRNSLKDYIFPFGVKLKKVKTSSFSIAEEIMFNMRNAEINKNCFIFPLLSEETHDPAKKLDDIIEATNPSRLLYLVCILADDFFKIDTDQEKSSKKPKDVWVVQKAYCIMTYYPFICFFFDLLIEILKFIKLTRMENISDQEIREGMMYEKIDSEYSLKVSKQLEDNLKIILDSQPPTFGDIINFDFSLLSTALNESLSLTVEEQSKAYLTESSWACPFVFRYFSLKDIIFLFSAVILDKKVILMSHELCLMTGALSVLYALMKPFKYPFPLIFNLPEVLIPILDAPGGLLVGIQKGEKFLLKEKLHEQYSCIYICLDEKRVYADESTLKEISLPIFNGFQQKLTENYKIFNQNQNYQVINFTSKPNESPGKLKKIRYDSQNDEKQASIKILETFRDTIIERVIKFIPPIPIYDSQKILAYSHIYESILRNNSVADHDFLNNFLKTQTFTHFLDQYYSIKLKKT